MTRPPPCARRWGRAARIRVMDPVRLVAMMWSTCASVSSSAAPNSPYPALETITSTRPAANASSTTARTAVVSVTSRIFAWKVSGYRLRRSVTLSRERTVPMTRSPRSRS